MTSNRQKTIRFPNDFQVPLVSALLEPTCLRNIKNGALDAGHRLRLCAWDFDWNVPPNWWVRFGVFLKRGQGSKNDLS